METARAEPAAPDERLQRRREYTGPASTLGVAALVVAVVGFVTWWFEFRERTGGEALDTAAGILDLPAALNQTGRAPAAEPGRAAPNFELLTLEGTPVRLSAFQGKLVVVNFWASWCAPCRTETPDLDALARAHAGDVVVIGVNQQEEPGAVRTFVAEFAPSYPIVLDRDGEVSAAYRVGRGLPVSFLIGRDGVISKVLPGQLGREELAAIAAAAGQ
jgi:thiol-disulfide isomerase/thioredoxin